jgi:hypothetical protein
MLGRRWHRLGGIAVALFAAVGCGGSDMQDPVDSAAADAWRVEQDRLVAERRAERESEATRQAELENAVRAIESETEDPPRLLAEQEVYQVLAYYCEACHFRPTGSTEAIDGFWDIDDMGEMVRIGKVFPGDGEGSRLIQRIRLGEMPPPDAEGVRIPEATVDRLVDYIDSLPLDFE